MSDLTTFEASVVSGLLKSVTDSISKAVLAERDKWVDFELGLPGVIDDNGLQKGRHKIFLHM